MNTWARSRAENIERDLLVAYPMIDIHGYRCYVYDVRPQG